MAVERLGQRADLIDFDEDRVGDAFRDAALEKRHVRHEEIVADELDALAERFGQLPPSAPNRPRLGRPRSRRSDSVRTSSVYSATISSR